MISQHLRSASDRLALHKLCKKSLKHFTQLAFAEKNSFRWQQSAHHDAIFEALERVYDGTCKRLIINVPPRYSKTEIAVVNFIAWALGRSPDAEFIHVSYSATLAVSNAANARSLVQSDFYKLAFPAVQLRTDSKSKGDWRTTAGGVVYAQGAGGTITGFGAGKMRPGFGGAIIVDDIHKADEATSDTMRGNVIDWFGNTLESRKNDPANTPIIIIMQRLHENDLSGFLLGGGNGEDWEHINLPAINADDTPLWPEKHSIEKLREMERANPYVFAGQYMQRPAPIGGGLWKTDWWQWFNPAAMPRFRRVIQSWDTAFKTKEANDYSVCTTWGETETGYYMLDIWKGKVEFPDLMRVAVSLAAKWAPSAVLVEDKASGQSMIQQLRRDTRLPVIACKKDTDKVACANLVAPLIESKRVYLPTGHPEIAAFLHSASQFPNGAHDDDIDSVSQALGYLSRGQPMQRIEIGGI